MVMIAAGMVGCGGESNDESNGDGSNNIGNDENGDGNSSRLTEEILVNGTWQGELAAYDGEEVALELDFRSNGNVVLNIIDEFGADSINSTWRLNNGIITLDMDWENTDVDIEPIIEFEVNNNRLYLDGEEYTRQGSGSGIVGVWRAEDGHWTWGWEELDFREDGTLFIDSDEQFSSFGVSFTWRTSGNMLHLEPQMAGEMINGNLVFADLVLKNVD